MALMDVGQRNRRFLKRALIACGSMFLFGFVCVPMYRVACGHGYLRPPARHAVQREQGCR